MKILIVDCTMDRDSWGAEDFRDILSATPGLDIFVRRAPNGDLPPIHEIFDRIIITGSRTSCLDESSWVLALLEYLRKKINQKTPILGVCFGLQMLSRIFGGLETLRESQSPEYGWVQVEVTGNNPILTGLPKKFFTLASHHEEVVTLPAKLVCSARSQDCSVQAFVHESAPFFGIQFHPEKTLEGAEKTYLSMKKSGKQHLFRRQKSSKKIYHSEIGEKILSNFIHYENT